MLVNRAAARRVGMLALAALAVLLAAVALARPVDGAPPADLELILSLGNDADNVVPPDTTVTVEAHLRHTGVGHHLEVTQGSLRTSGYYDFEGSGRSKVDLAAQQIGAAAWRGSGAETGDRFGAFGGTILDNDTFFAKSLQSDFDGQVWATRTGKVYVYDVPTKTEIGVITPPTGGTTHSFAEGFDAYQEDASTGWIFIGSWREALTVSGVTCRAFPDGRASIRNDRTSTGTTCNEVGRVYIYRLDRSVSPMTISSTPCATLTPSAADAVYAQTASGASLGGRFGHGVEVNEATDTLVVGAPKMHYTGAVKVYTKPTSAGGWCDLTYADAVTLTPTPIPTEGAWGSATNKQKSYAERMWSDGPGGAAFGQEIKMSADGSTLVIGAFLKRHNDSNALYASGIADTGEVGIYVKPATGWADATAPNARLWLTPTVNEPRLGQWVAVTHDGASIAAAAPQRPQVPPTSPGYVYVWNRPSGGWTTDDSNGADATLSAVGGRDSDQFGHSSIDFNHDGTRLLVSNHKYQDAARGASDGRWLNSNASYAGRAWLFSGTNGSWASATTASATEIQSPAPQPGVFFGVARYASDGRQILVGQPEDTSLRNNAFGPGRVWLYNEQLAPQFFAGSACRIESGDILDDVSDDINSCPLTLPARTEITVPPGAVEGTFTVSGSVTIDGQAYAGSLAVRVGTIKEVADATLDFAIDDRGSVGVRDDRPWPSAIAPGGRTVLRLSLVSEAGQAPAAGSVGSILVTTTAGRLSSNINDEELAPAAFSTARRNQDGCRGTGGFACQVPVGRTVLTSSNADEILVTLSAPSNARPGTATVIARVTSLAGDAFTDTVTVAITGAFKTLEIEEPLTSVLNVDTPDSGAMRDNQDIALLSVTAQDESGNRVMVPGTEPATVDSPRAIPTHRLTIKGPDGKSNPAGISARWLPNTAGTGLELDADDNPQIEIDVDAAADVALPSGEYTIEARVNRQTWSQTFRVASGPTALTLSAPAEDVAVGSRITVSATVTDSDGRPVSDGTEVTFTERGIGTSAVLILTSSSRQRTVDGQASVELLVVSAGVAYVTVEAGDIADARVIRASGNGAAPVESERLSSTRANDFSVWLSQTPTEAALLLPELEGVLSILLWEVDRWLRYAVIGGRLVPGSTDFEIPRGAVLWLANGN